ncbi:MAG: vancomycin high temperature exclusion protein [Bernardetiaceae bacterium]
MKRYLLLIAVGIPILSLLASDYYVSYHTDQRLFNDPTTMEARPVGLLLGTSPRTRDGKINPYFRYRIEAAARLYHSGKVQHLLLSGDNRRQDYNEPVYMRAALRNHGIPDQAMTLDFAGFRTLDSVVRCRVVFGQARIVVISQDFHNQRALFLCDAFGLDAVGFNARHVPSNLKMRFREMMARVKAILDVYVLGTEPHFLGTPEPILP